MLENHLGQVHVQVTPDQILFGRMKCRPEHLFEKMYNLCNALGSARLKASGGCGISARDYLYREAPSKYLPSSPKFDQIS